MNKTYLLLLLLLITKDETYAQWTNNANLNTEVKDSVGYEESVPISATTSDGYTYVSFFALYNGSYQLRMQLLDVSGHKLWSPQGLLVSNQPQSSAIFLYDMKVDANDNAIVAFQDIRTNGDLNVVVYKVDTAGNLLWGANGIQLIDPLSTEGLAPSIGFTNAGNVIIGWNASASNNKWVAFQKLDPNGVLLWTNNLRVIDSTAVHKFSRQTFVPCGNDDFIMLYVDESGFGLPPGTMRAQRYASNGNNVWPNPVQVSTNKIPFFFFCKAVSDNNSGFFTSFNSGNIANQALTDVYAQHVDSNGNLWNATGNVAITSTSTQKYTPASRYDAAGNALWVLIKVTDVNQSMSGVAIQKFDATGNVLLSNNGVELAPVASAYYDPQDLCVTTDGVISVYKTGGSLIQTLLAVKNDLSGSVVWTNPVAICSNTAGKDDLTMGAFSNNQAVVVWDDNRNDYGVYAQNITNDGLLGVATSISNLSSLEINFAASPNPFYNQLQISINPISDNKQEPLFILDATGRIVFELSISKVEENITIATHQWSSGIYCVKYNNRFAKIIKH